MGDAIVDTKYLRKEVADFRAIFQMFDTDHSGDMGFDEFQTLLSQIFPVKTVCGAKMKKELEALLKDTPGVDEAGEGELDFPGFLRIMRRLQDENFAGINDKCHEITHHD